MKKIGFTVLYILCFYPVLAAQEVDVVSQKLPTQASFAKPFALQVELAHTPGYSVQIDPSSVPEGFEILSQQQTALSPGTTSYQADILPFSLGASTFTAVNFNLVDAHGKTVSQAHTDPATITVEPVQFFKDKSLRDIRPPYIPFSWLGWVLMGLALLAIGLLWHYLRRRAGHAASVVQLPPDNRPADVIALSQIQFLLQSGLWEKQEYKLFYIELGAILREYFWRRFSLDVSADTSAELLRRARTVPQLAVVLQQLRNYLNSADLVKFAQVIPSTKTMQQDVAILQQVVKQTTPPPVTSQEVH